MTDKELDDLFKKSLEAHEMRLPDDMWQRVQPKKEKKRRGAILWWTWLGVAALLFFSNAATLFFTAHLAVSKKAVTASLQNKNKQPLTVIRSAQKEPSLKSNMVINSRNSSDLLVVKHSAHKKNKDSKLLFSGKEKATNNKNIKVILSSSFYKEKKGQHQNVAAAKNNVSNSFINKTNNDTAVTSINTIIEETHVEKDKSVDTITNNTPTKQTVAAADKAMVTIKKISRKQAANIEWMVAGYTGNRHVYGIENNAPPSFVSLNDPKEETVLHSISLTMRIEKPINKNISFKTGLQFLQTQQSITFNEEEINLYATVNTLSVRADTTRFTQISFHRPNLKSVYNSLNIPLLINYETAGASLKVGASAGVVVNLFSWYKGEVPDGNYHKTMAANNAFRLNSGASLYLSFYAAKSLGKWQLFAEPNVQYALSSVTKNNVAFKQKITNYGVGIGIRKRIGK